MQQHIEYIHNIQQHIQKTGDTSTYRINEKQQHIEYRRYISIKNTGDTVAYRIQEKQFHIEYRRYLKI